MLVILGVVSFGTWAPYVSNYNDGFAIGKISSTLTGQPAWEVAPLAPEAQQQIERILDQRFFYLGKGAQCYAFASHDGCYVLKLFKHQHLAFPGWFMQLPLPPALDRLRHASAERKQKKIETLFQSYKIAFEHLSEETGVIDVHLNKGYCHSRPVILVDKLGHQHSLGIGNFEFVVQKKADPLTQKIIQLMEAGNVASAKTIVQNAFALVYQRCRKGFIDTDPAFLQNYGVDGLQVIQVDAGRIQYDEGLLRNPQRQHERTLEETRQLLSWCQSLYPMLVGDLLLNIDRENSALSDSLGRELAPCTL